jgi:NAD(P)-dependent dehydrogenase (short-subunit alcohol dehydrogenase family)
LQNIAEAFASQGWGLEVIDARTDDDRRRIAQNLADTFAAQGWDVQITDRRDSP